jgi:hypothetical protein
MQGDIGVAFGVIIEQGITSTSRSKLPLKKSFTDGPLVGGTVSAAAGCASPSFASRRFFYESWKGAPALGPASASH